MSTYLVSGGQLKQLPLAQLLPRGALKCRPIYVTLVTGDCHYLLGYPPQCVNVRVLISLKSHSRHVFLQIILTVN